MMFLFFCVILIVLSLVRGSIAYAGVIGGIGLILLALTIQTQGIQMVTGLNETVDGSSILTNYVYTDVQDVYPDLSVYFLPAITIIIGGIGIMSILSDVLE